MLEKKIVPVENIGVRKLISPLTTLTLTAYYLNISTFRFLNSSREIVPASRRDFNFSHSAFLPCFSIKAHSHGATPEAIASCISASLYLRSFISYRKSQSLIFITHFITNASVHFLLPNVKLRRAPATEGSELERRVRCGYRHLLLALFPLVSGARLLTLLECG